MDGPCKIQDVIYLKKSKADRTKPLIYHVSNFLFPKYHKFRKNLIKITSV